jgi:hypothetical protein
MFHIRRCVSDIREQVICNIMLQHNTKLRLTELGLICGSYTLPVCFTLLFLH